MIQTTITLAAAAKLFKVHPRTIVRAVADDYNAYWTPDSDEDIYEIADIAAAFGVKDHLIRCLLDERDELVTAQEAAAYLGIAGRTFRVRVREGRYDKIKRGGITRYRKSQVIEDAIASLHLE